MSITLGEMDKALKDYAREIEQEMNRVLFAGLPDSWMLGVLTKQEKMEQAAQYADARRESRANIDMALKSGATYIPVPPELLLRLLDDAESWLAEVEEAENAKPPPLPEVPPDCVRVPEYTTNVIFINDDGDTQTVQWDR